MNKDLRNTVIWLVFAMAMVCVGFWQAQIAVAKEAQARNKTLPPPLKTRHAIRPAPANLVIDPVADYIARCEKGMTDQEIGWIVEDFRNAGLGLGIRTASPEEYFKQRNAQHQWYRDALTEGLILTPDQAKQAASKIGALFEQAKAEFLTSIEAAPKPFQTNGRWYQVTNADMIRPLINAETWLQNPDYSPESLCSLTPEQIRLLTGTTPFFDPRKLTDTSATSSTGIDMAKLRKMHPAEFKIFILQHPEMITWIQNQLDSNNNQ